MAVDPRVGATHSRIQESRRNGHSGGRIHVVKHNLDRRIASKNVFNRLGRGANMRETLNRRREQERSQYSTTQRVHSKVNSQGIRKIPLDNLQ